MSYKDKPHKLSEMYMGKKYEFGHTQYDDLKNALLNQGYSDISYFKIVYFPYTFHKAFLLYISPSDITDIIYKSIGV